MAYLRRVPKSPYWIAAYRDKNGRLQNKSTKLTATPANRKEAQQIAVSYEEAHETRTVVKTLRDNYSKIAQNLNRSWNVPTVKDFISNWTAMYAPKLSDATKRAYQYRFNDFLEFMKETGRQDFCVDELMEDDTAVIEYRNRLLASVSTVTAKTAMTILSGAFSYGIRKGYFIENKFDELADIKETDATEKRPFTLDELKLVLESCTPEWRSLVLFGLYTGQRLSDVATLTWGQIDTRRNEVAFITKKTGRRMALPIARALRTHIDTLRKGTPDAPVHPEAERMMSEQGKAGSLSRQFNEILQKVNLVPKKSHHKARGAQETGSKRVTVNPLSFHSLRHTAATLLRMTGSSEAVAREIIGHDSASVDRGYVHMDPSSMQAALDKLPDVTSV